MKMLRERWREEQRRKEGKEEQREERRSMEKFQRYNISLTGI